MSKPGGDAINASLPGILCLHAYGTNATIFQYQLRHITQALKNTFHFVFIEAPFHVEQPGPGVPPGFVDARPFHRWHSDKTLATAFGVGLDDLQNERLQVRALLKGAIEAEKRRTSEGPGIVGVMAFSQGASLAAGLCMDLELGKDIKFAIIFCALYPALTLTENDDETIPSSIFDPPSIARPSPRVDIGIPSIHIQGTSDPWRGQGSRTLGQYFDSGQAKTIVLAGLRHEVPSKARDVGLVVDEIRDIWKSREDILQLGA